VPGWRYETAARKIQQVEQVVANDNVAVLGPWVVGQPENSRRFRSSDVERRQESSWAGIQPKQTSQVNTIEIEHRCRQLVKGRIGCKNPGEGTKIHDDKQLVW
jgi:hypothetical protein